MILNNFNSLFELFSALNFTYFTIGRKDTRLITLNDNILEYYKEVESTLDEIQKDLDFNKETLTSKKQYYKEENFEIPLHIVRVIQIAKGTTQPLSIDKLISDLDDLEKQLLEMRNSVKRYFDRTILPPTFSHASIYASLYSILLLFIGTFHENQNNISDINNVEEGLLFFNFLSIFFILSCIWLFDYEKIERKEAKTFYEKIKSFFRIINFPKTIFWFSLSLLLSIIMYCFYLPNICKFIHSFCENHRLNLNSIIVFSSLLIPISHFIYYILVKILWLVLSLFQSKTDLSKLKEDITSYKTDVQSNLDMFEEIFKHLLLPQENYEIKQKPS